MSSTRVDTDSAVTSTVSTQESPRPAKPRVLSFAERERLMLISNLQGLFPSHGNDTFEKALDLAEGEFDRAVDLIIDGKVQLTPGRR